MTGNLFKPAASITPTETFNAVTGVLEWGARVKLPDGTQRELGPFGTRDAAVSAAHSAVAHAAKEAVSERSNP